MKKNLIDINPRIKGGIPVVAGTRIPIKRIEYLLRKNLTPKEIAEKYYTQLSVSQVEEIRKVLQIVQDLDKTDYPQSSVDIKRILQTVHDDAVSPTHDPRLGYSEKAVEELNRIIAYKDSEIERLELSEKSLERRLGRRETAITISQVVIIGLLTYLFFK